MFYVFKKKKGNIYEFYENFYVILMNHIELLKMYIGLDHKVTRKSEKIS